MPGGLGTPCTAPFPRHHATGAPLRLTTSSSSETFPFLPLQGEERLPQIQRHFPLCSSTAAPPVPEPRRLPQQLAAFLPATRLNHCAQKPAVKSGSTPRPHSSPSTSLATNPTAERPEGPGARGTWPPGRRPLILFIRQTPAAAGKEVGQAGKLAGRYRSCHRRMTAPRTSDPHQVTRCPCPAAEGPGPPLRQQQEGFGPPLTPSLSRGRAGAELPE